ncbi:MAG: peptidase M41, partial [Cyclobacteriaceae bacterium]|nr:peptidase M41 [Cyclobacteriaceae bacterium]
MATKKKKGITPPKLPQPKQNYQLWVIITLVLVISSILWMNNSNSLVEISERRFSEMALSHDVEKVTFIRDQNIVEVQLKKEALSNAKYKMELENRVTIGDTETGPQYKFKVLSADKWDDKVKELNTKLGEDDKIDYGIEERGDPTAMIFNWGFLLLILFGFWFMMRRMTGQGGPGGQIFNIGKSKAALFDADNKVKISFNDVAGLEEAKEEVKEIVDF